MFRTTTTTEVPVAHVVGEQTIVVDDEVIEAVARAKKEAHAKEEHRIASAKIDEERRVADARIRSEREALTREAALKEEVLRSQRAFFEEQQRHEAASWRAQHPREAAAHDDHEVQMKREVEWAETERLRVLAVEQRKTDEQNAALAASAFGTTVKVAAGAAVGAAVAMFF